MILSDSENLNDTKHRAVSATAELLVIISSHYAVSVSSEW